MVSRLNLDGVTVEFGGTTALDDVSLDVRDGEFFTLVGPSGCGKTTTLRTVAGFEAPDVGTVRFDDEDVTGVPPEARGVGVVFQNYALFPHRTVAENVAYGLQFREPPGSASVDDRVTELLDLVDLTGLGDRDPDTLSGGQQQRVALARALAPGPDVLLLDEPMSALDARLRQRLRVQVTDIQEELGITTLYVTHDQAEALAISDRVAVMHDGRVEQVGTPETVYRQPTSRFVASFVGDNNVFDGRASPLETEGSVVDVGVGELRTDDHVSGDVTVCIRPEDLSFGSGENECRVTVDHTEFLGDAYKVHCDWHGRPLLVKADDAPATGEARVSFPASAVQVVD